MYMYVYNLFDDVDALLGREASDEGHDRGVGVLMQPECLLPKSKC